MNTNNSSATEIKLQLTETLIDKIKKIAESKGMTFNEACLYILQR